MRQAPFRLLLGLTLAFAVDCGAVSGGGSGTGGAGAEGGSNQTGEGGSGTGGDHLTGSGGAGGDHSSGGAGGGHATGGAPGSGGAGDSPATGGSGGAPATGGAGGSHATGGAGGGATGSGGHAGAGTGGSTGAGGQGGSAATCAQLQADYLGKLPAARACTPGAANQCQQLEPITLGNCANCKFYVNDPTALTPIVDQWTQLGCGTSTPVCLIACISPGNPGDCVATDGAAPGGVCGSGVATPTN